jgi:hypothetical protein
MAVIRITPPHPMTSRLTTPIQNYVESETVTANQRCTATRAPTKNNDEFRDLSLATRNHLHRSLSMRTGYLSCHGVKKFEQSRRFGGANRDCPIDVRRAAHYAGLSLDRVYQPRSQTASAQVSLPALAPRLHPQAFVDDSLSSLGHPHPKRRSVSRRVDPIVQPGSTRVLKSAIRWTSGGAIFSVSEWSDDRRITSAPRIDS